MIRYWKFSFEYQPIPIRYRGFRGFILEIADEVWHNPIFLFWLISNWYLKWILDRYCPYFSSTGDLVGYYGEHGTFTATSWTFNNILTTVCALLSWFTCSHSTRLKGSEKKQSSKRWTLFSPLARQRRTWLSVNIQKTNKEETTRENLHLTQITGTFVHSVLPLFSATCTFH